jgi:hypothetical protein
VEGCTSFLRAALKFGFLLSLRLLVGSISVLAFFNDIGMFSLCSQNTSSVAMIHTDIIVTISLCRWSMETGGFSRGAPELHDMLGEYVWSESPVPVCTPNQDLFLLTIFVCLLAARKPISRMNKTFGFFWFVLLPCHLSLPYI